MIFGRKGPLAGEFEPEFRKLDRESPAKSAKARNWRYDDRIPQGRYQLVERFVEEVRSSEGLSIHDALSRYFQQRVRKLKRPAFRLKSNEENFHGGLTPHRLRLLRVIELSGLLELFRSWATHDPVFVDVPKASDCIPGKTLTTPSGWQYQKQPAAVCDWFEKKLTSGSDIANQRFLQAILSNLNRTHENAVRTSKGHHQPVWVTVDRPELRDPKLKPNQLVHSLGLYFTYLPTWVMVVRYRADEVDQLVRPTTVDGASEYHFPSPAQVEANRGGHTMDLSDQSTGSRLFSEYLHVETTIHPTQATLAWHRLEEKAPSRKLHHYRQSQYEALKDEYGAIVPVQRWMPSHAVTGAKWK